MKKLFLITLVIMGVFIVTQAIEVNIGIGRPQRTGVIYVTPSPDYIWDPGYGEYDDGYTIRSYSHRGWESRHSHDRSYNRSNGHRH